MKNLPISQHDLDGARKADHQGRTGQRGRTGAEFLGHVVHRLAGDQATDHGHGEKGGTELNQVPALGDDPPDRHAQQGQRRPQGGLQPARQCRRVFGQCDLGFRNIDD